MSERNDGRKLEAIVALIEGAALPPGFKVERRHCVYDDDGNELAELDILISGPVGTGTWKWLIECRDRPSVGPQPRQWVEQLIGRRSSLNLDKVTAVSSTGFAPGAQTLANASGVLLRTFQTFTADDVPAGIPLNAPIVQSKPFVNVRMPVWSPDLPEEKHGKGVAPPVGDACVVDKGTRRRMTLDELFNQEIAPSNKAAMQAANAGEPQKIVATPEFLQRYTIEMDGLSFEIQELEFDVEYRSSQLKLPLKMAGGYVDENGETIRHVAHWKGQPSDPVQEMWVILTPKGKGNDSQADA